MKIATLIENTAINNNFKSTHGLSFYIETQKHKMLIDVGPNEDFIYNAKLLNINIEDVDVVIITHGHSDHGGGLDEFLNINNKAKIYINEKAFANYYAKTEENYIGLNKKLHNNERIVLISDEYKIDNELFIFAEVKKNNLASSANNTLFAEIDGKLENDKFHHEQFIVITEENNSVLIGGCAHKGVTNIIDEYKEKFSNTPNYIISGFHLYNPGTGKSESEELVLKISDKLKEYETKIFTCHCTGSEAYGILKNELKDKIEYLATGSVIEL